MKTHLLLAAATLLAASSAYAAAGTWSVDANGTWSTDTNWTTSAIADGETFVASFTNNITADRTVSLDTVRTIGGLTFNDAGASGDSNWILDNNGSATNILTLDNFAGAGTGTTGSAINVTNTATISAQLAGGVLSKAGGGVLVLTNASNSYSGSINGLSTGLYISENGTVRVDSNGALGAAGATIQTNTGTGGILASTAAGILVTGRQVFLFAGAGGITFGDSVGTGDMSFTNINRGAGSTDRSINVANAGQTVTFTGNFVSTGSSTSGTTFIKGGAGTLTIQGTGNTEAGYSKITVTGGTLNGTKFADLGVASSFGRASVASATGLMTLDGGAIGLVDGGSSSSTNRAIQIGRTTAGGTGSILNNATSNTLAFTNAALTYGTVNQTRSLTLGGTNTGANSFGSVIGNNGTGLVSVSKIGVGTWALSGANSYTGATTVSAGTLNIASTGSINIGAAGVTVANNTATLAVDGKLVLTSLTPGLITNSGGIITLNAGSAVLDLNSLFNGATDGQTYQLISGGGTTGNFNSFANYAGSLGVSFDASNGTLTFQAVPEPSTYGLIGAGALAAVAVVRRRRKLDGKAA